MPAARPRPALGRADADGAGDPTLCLVLSYLVGVAEVQQVVVGDAGVLRTHTQAGQEPLRGYKGISGSPRSAGMQMLRRCRGATRYLHNSLVVEVVAERGDLVRVELVGLIRIVPPPQQQARPSVPLVAACVTLQGRQNQLLMSVHWPVGQHESSVSCTCCAPPDDELYNLRHTRPLSRPACAIRPWRYTCCAWHKRSPLLQPLDETGAVHSRGVLCKRARLPQHSRVHMLVFACRCSYHKLVRPTRFVKHCSSCDTYSQLLTAHLLAKLQHSSTMLCWIYCPGASP